LEAPYRQDWRSLATVVAADSLARAVAAAYCPARTRTHMRKGRRQNNTYANVDAAPLRSMPRLLASMPQVGSCAYPITNEA
jgi:hypothetical protein